MTTWLEGSIRSSQPNARMAGSTPAQVRSFGPLAQLVERHVEDVGVPCSTQGRTTKVDFFPRFFRSRSVEEKKDPQTRERNGRYGYIGKLDRLCVCGHRLGDHTADAPHECLGDCLCERFRPKKVR